MEEVVVDEMNVHSFRIYEQGPLKLMVGNANVLLGTVIQEILYNTLDIITSKKRRKSLTGKTKCVVYPVVDMHQVCTLYYSSNGKMSVHSRGATVSIFINLE